MHHNLHTTQRPWAELRPHPANPRNGDIDAIAASLQTNGQYRPIVTTTDGTILAGNHTYMAAGQLGWDSLAAVTLDLDPHSPEARRIMLADNRTADLGQYDDALLLDLLAAINQADGGLEGTGYSDDDLGSLTEALARLDATEPDLDGDDLRAPTTGELLAVADVAVGEPTRRVHHGQRWTLGHHILVVARVHDEHHLWADHLAGRLFAPYPDPYLPLADRPRAEPCLFVQPNPYLAGHLLDKYAACFGDTSVAPVGP